MMMMMMMMMIDYSARTYEMTYMAVTHASGLLVNDLLFISRS